jgi:putative RNA 2'-phosphotransferase
MDADRAKRLSKFLSFVLRHRPDAIGLTLDGAGWVAVDELLRCAADNGRPFSLEELTAVVGSNDKQRFAFSEDRRRIRASQGHSVQIALGYTPEDPPERLYHGTVARVLDAIRREGLQKRARSHVHLSARSETAVDVGKRRGVPVVLTVQAAAMAADGHLFYLTPNRVWLTEEVPPRYILFP